MAETLKVTGILNDTGISLTRSVSNLAVTTAGDGWDYVKVSVANANTNVAPSVSQGWTMIVNKDATNFVSVYANETAATNDTPFAKLKAGEFALLPLHPDITNLIADADTAACVCEFYFREA